MVIEYIILAAIAYYALKNKQSQINESDIFSGKINPRIGLSNTESARENIKLGGLDIFLNQERNLMG